MSTKGADSKRSATAPSATVYGIVLDELRALDGIAVQDRMMDTAEAARVLSLAPKTVAKWAGEGRFSGAHKTSDARDSLTMRGVTSNSKQSFVVRQPLPGPSGHCGACSNTSVRTCGYQS